MGNGCFDLARPGLRVAIATGAGETVRFAAEQLAYYLALITGEGPRVEEREEVSGTTCHVSGNGSLTPLPPFPSQTAPGRGGNSNGSHQAEFAPTGIEGGEEYHIGVSTDGIGLEGSDGLGLLHAVYHFLESKCGCRWLAAFEGGEIVPRNTRLTVPACDQWHHPAFRHRAFTNFPDINERTVEMVDWMAKNRFNRFMVFANMQGSFERYQETLKPHLLLRGMRVELGHHSFRFWLPPEEFFGVHPEWYSLNGGQRRTDGQLCTSNPRVAEVVAERINVFFAEHPEVDTVGLWPNDGYGWCECEACAKLEPQRPSALVPSQPARTDTYMRFVSQVAKAVGQAHPKRRLSALAYVNYVEAPTTSVPANVAVCFAPFMRCFKHPLDAPRECVKDNARYAELFRQWRRKVSGKLYLFCYLMLIDTCSLPYRITRMLGPYFRWLQEEGCDGYVMEFKPEEWGPFGVNAHLIGRLSWEPDMDVEAWLRGYYANLYGPAAEEMAQYWQQYLDAFVEPGPCVFHYDLTYTRRATPELLAGPLAHLAKARVLAAAGERRHWEAVERDQVGVELLLRMGEWQRAVAAARQAPEGQRNLQAQRARALGEELATWADQHSHTDALHAPYLKRRIEAELQQL